MVIQIGATALIGLLFSLFLNLIQIGETSFLSMFIGYQIGAFVPVMAAFTASRKVKTAV